MKIGLLTHHWVPNFGANLQALSTYRFLKNQGHAVIVINYQPEEMVSLYEKKINSDQLILHKNFVSENFELTEVFHSEQSLIDSIKDYNFDLVLAGSDALFRLNEKSTREDLNFPNPFWLHWLDSNESVKKGFVSVSSMGTDFSKLEASTQNDISQHLENFDFVSVRDSWTRKSLQGLNPRLKLKETVDPVFLLNDSLSSEEFGVGTDDNYILLSPYRGMLSDKWIKSFVNIANKEGYQVYGLSNPEGHFIDEGLVNKLLDFPLSPTQWYSYIANSKGFVGVRFHPVVVSLANYVPFISLDTYQKHLFNAQISKTYDIAQKLGKGKYCLGKIERKLLSPKRAFNMLKSQMDMKQSKLYEKILSELKQDFRDMILSYLK